MPNVYLKSLRPIVSVGVWFVFMGMAFILINPLGKFAQARDVGKKDLVFRLAVAMEACYTKNHTHLHDCTTVEGLHQAGLIIDPELIQPDAEGWNCAPGCVSALLEDPVDPTLPYWKYEESGRGQAAASPCSGSCW